MVSTKTTHSFVDCTEYSWNKDLSRDESTPRPKVQEPRDEKIVYSRNELLKLVQDHEMSTITKFIPQANAKYDIGKGKCKGKVHWNADTHLPYIVTGYLRWYCQHSKDRHREKKLCSESDECSDRSDGNQKFKHSRHSSKRDCKAYIVASEIMQFPDYKSFFTSSRRARKQLSDRLLVMAKENDTNLVKETVFRVSLPPLSSHTGHEVGEAAGELQRLDRKLIDKIHEYVELGISSTSTVQRLLRGYVVKELFRDQSPPSPSNRRFFPTVAGIRNHIYNARLKLQEADKPAVVADLSGTAVLEEEDELHHTDALPNRGAGSLPPVSSTPTPRREAPCRYPPVPNRPSATRKRKNPKPQRRSAAFDSYLLPDELLSTPADQIGLLGPYEVIIESDELVGVDDLYSGGPFDDVTGGDVARQPETTQRRTLSNIKDTLIQIRQMCDNEAPLDVLQESEIELQAVLNRMLQARTSSRGNGERTPGEESRAPRLKRPALLGDLNYFPINKRSKKT